MYKLCIFILELFLSCVNMFSYQLIYFSIYEYILCMYDVFTEAEAGVSSNELKY
jgi:hypothetical protein